MNKLFQWRSAWKMAGFIVIFLILSCDARTQIAKTEILWDHYGVPHIYGKNTAEMYYGFGWAQMQNHADLILQLYGEARGRASEYWGVQYLESDKKICLFSIPEQAKLNYSKQNPLYKSYMDAFVQGVNAYAEAHPEAIGDKVKKILPVTGVDVIAHMLRVLCIEFIAGEDLATVAGALAKGSNAYAIAPSKSASGHAMLLANPHLPWSNFFLWFEAHLISGDFDAYGVALVGVPTLTMAFNKHLGWALTVNTMDGSDRYELKLQDDKYLWDGEYKALEKKTHSFKILEKDGSFREVVSEFEYSVHGPVLGKKDPVGYALRFVGMENVRIFEQYHKMAASGNLNEFETSLEMLQNPMFNILYADQEGNILYFFNGNIPVRSEGDFAFWKGTIDGTTSKYLWNDTHAYEDLPKVINPPSGFLQNCNDPPWTCTVPAALNPADFPVYMAPQFMHWRAQRATNMIKGNPKITFDQLIDYKLNTGIEIADRFLDDLFMAVEKYPDTTALRAVSLLKKWDRKTENDSRGAVLFTRWFDQVRYNMFATPWDAGAPSTTPDGISDEKGAVDFLVKTANDMQNEFGTLNVAWGDLHRFGSGGNDYPANGGPGKYGIFRTIDYMADGNHKMRAFAGDTYIAVVEFGNQVHAQVLLGYGNASQPGNKHVGDQFGLMSDKKLRSALLEKREILANLEKRELPFEQ